MKNPTKNNAAARSAAAIVGTDPHHMAMYVAATGRRLSDAGEFSLGTVADALSVQAADLCAQVGRFLAFDAEHHGQAQSLWPSLIVLAFPEWHSPPDLCLMLVMIVMMCRRNRSAGAAVHDFIEYSAGTATLTLQCLLQGLAGIALDKAFVVDHDNTTATGMRLWINEMTVTKERALNWFGTQCSSFSILCKSNSQRWESNGFLGDMSKEFVRYGNRQMVITSLLMLLSHWCGNVPVLEQPLNSTMPKCAPLRTALDFVEATKVVTWHKAFGSASMKPLQILSNSAVIASLRRPKPNCKSSQLAKHGGDGTLSGIKHKLLASQAYTPMFGRAVADMMKGH